MPAVPKTARGEATRRAILDAAETVIGRDGFNEASIGAIARAAGVAAGTFYIYFKSKDAVFRALILEMGTMLRHFLAEATADCADRIAVEREGLRGFLTFVARHPNMYRIIQEAMFVDPDAYRAYFQSFAEAYAEALEEAEAKGEVRKGDSFVRAWALMGIAKTLGERYAVYGDKRPIEDLVDSAHDLIVHGLKP